LQQGAGMPVRKIPKSYRAITGRFPSFINGRCVSYESSLERDFFLSLEFDPSVVSYEEQPIRLTEIRQGKQLTYTPDCLVSYSGGKPDQLVECKYLSELIEKASVYEPKFAMARKYTNERDMEFLVINDEDLRKIPLANYRLLYRFTKPPNNLPLYRDHIITVMNEAGNISLRDLLNRLAPDRSAQAAFTPLIWHLLFTRTLFADLSEPIGYQTLLRS
jgi:hypothetical protein